MYTFLASTGSLLLTDQQECTMAQRSQYIQVWSSEVKREAQLMGMVHVTVSGNVAAVKSSEPVLVLATETTQGVEERVTTGCVVAGFGTDN